MPKDVEVVNVTGAGDTLVGYLAAKISELNWLHHEVGRLSRFGESGSQYIRRNWLRV